MDQHKLWILHQTEILGHLTKRHLFTTKVALKCSNFTSRIGNPVKSQGTWHVASTPRSASVKTFQLPIGLFPYQGVAKIAVSFSESKHVLNKKRRQSCCCFLPRTIQKKNLATKDSEPSNLEVFYPPFFKQVKMQIQKVCLLTTGDTQDLPLWWFFTTHCEIGLDHLPR